MAISERETTVHVSGLTVVEFTVGYPYFSVRNDGNDIIYMSLSDTDCTPGANGVTAFPSGGTGVVGINVSGGHTTLYFNGSGTMSVTAQYDAICRYGSAGGGGGGSSSAPYILPVATRNELGGVKAYDVTVSPDGKMYVTRINGIDVDDYINNLIGIAIGKLKKLEVVIVDELPETGESDKIYWVTIPDSTHYHQWGFLNGIKPEGIGAFVYKELGMPSGEPPRFVYMGCGNPAEESGEEMAGRFFSFHSDTAADTAVKIVGYQSEYEPQNGDVIRIRFTNGINLPEDGAPAYLSFDGDKYKIFPSFDPFDYRFLNGIEPNGFGIFLFRKNVANEDVFVFISGTNNNGSSGSGKKKVVFSIAPDKWETIPESERFDPEVLYRASIRSGPDDPTILEMYNATVSFYKECYMHTSAVLDIADVVDVNVMQSGDIFRTAVALYYIGNEGVSLLENIGSMGVKLPPKLLHILEQLSNENDDEEDKNK